jgi:5-methylcytosine-specific restriction endonuclease McrA
VRAIQSFREKLAARYAAASLVQLRQRAPGEFGGLRDQVERHLIEMPLPRVQNVGNSRDAFIYEWDAGVTRAEVRKYQNGKPSDFDNRIRLRPGVERHLIDLNGLLRPLIQRQWSAMVARLNDLEEARLECFLFGADRTPLTAVVPALHDLQTGLCFYCQSRLTPNVHVDHFIPWSRYPENGLANLVLAHPGCNLEKKDFLAATPHVIRWNERLTSKILAELESQLRWDAAVDEMRGVARGIYLRLPEDALLWTSGKTFDRPDLARLRSSLA